MENERCNTDYVGRGGRYVRYDLRTTPALEQEYGTLRAVELAEDGSSIYQTPIVDEGELCGYLPGLLGKLAVHGALHYVKGCENLSQGGTRCGGLLRKVRIERYLEGTARFLIELFVSVSSDEIVQTWLEAGLPLPTIRSQMESSNSKLSVQGLSIQESSQEGNTIITRDAAAIEAPGLNIDGTSVVKHCSTEEVHEFGSLVGRWMPYKSVPVTVSNVAGTEIVRANLPQDLFSAAYVESPNLLPFETFVYGSYDIEMKFVVNANKFHCGKLVASAFMDSYRGMAMYDQEQSMLTRPHIILDLSTNTEGVLKIPFVYHRSFVRNLKVDESTIGVYPAQYATLLVKVLSPLRTGLGGAQDMNVRLFYRFTRAEFAGMSYRVNVQMETALAVAGAASAFRMALRDAEKTVHFLGKINNRDKPADLKMTRVTPEGRPTLAHGVGLDGVIPLRLDPTAATNYHVISPVVNEPSTTLDIARIWGCRAKFMWRSGQAEGTTLLTLIADPTLRGYGSTDLYGQITPLEYISTIYQFWSGTIEVRVDFVSNAFHTGSVMLSAEFVRKPTQDDPSGMIRSASTYTKTFHLGEQKSVSFRVPYIYDTVMRRSNQPTWFENYQAGVPKDADMGKMVSLYTPNETRFKIRVINQLRPVASASQEIECLVFWRASENFNFHSLKPSYIYRYNAMGSDKTYGMDKFPENYKRDVGATVQMDTGDKETEDPTANFNVGLNNRVVFSSDPQSSIKTILRRSILMFNEAELKNVAIKGAGGFYIPLMPPSKMWSFMNASSENTSLKWQETFSMTPHAMLVDLFRFWRGSMRYTIILTSQLSGAPVYFTHLPHSGTRIIGNHSMGDSDNAGYILHGAGFSSAVMCPIVNTTITVEVPYDSENNWTLCWDDDPALNYTWRDKGDTNAGHLVISSTNDCKVDIWWSAGDDFELSNFCGMPFISGGAINCTWDDRSGRNPPTLRGGKIKVTKAQEKLALTEEERARKAANEVSPGPTTSKPRSQMEAAGGCLDALWSVAQPKFLVRAALGSIPVVGAGVGVATVMGVADDAKVALERVGKAADKVERVGEIVEDMESRVQDLCSRFQVGGEEALSSLNMFFGQMAGMVGSLPGYLGNVASFVSILFDSFVDMVVAWTTASWTVVGATVIKLVCKFFSYHCISKCLEWAQICGAIFSSYVGAAGPRVQADAVDFGARFSGLVCGVLGTILGVHLDAGKYVSLARGCLERLTQSAGVSYVLNVMRFFESIFSMLRGCVMDALGFVDPSARALKLLSGKSVQLAAFVSAAQCMTSETNFHLLSNPRFKVKFWHTVVQAYQIQKLMLVSASNPASAPLFRLCSDVIKVANERFIDLASSPVRFEPFVVCIRGEPGIGKSYLVESLVQAMLGAIGVDAAGANPIYTRSPGSKFWSGYRNQPVVLYDDWMNISAGDHAVQQVSELYQLKTTATFIPEMAHLEDKRMQANPLIVVLVTNDAFPTAVSNVAPSCEAVFRRRDVVVEAQLVDGLTRDDVRKFVPQSEELFPHLVFGRYANVTDSTSLGRQRIAWEAFRDWMSATFVSYHSKETVKVQMRLRALTRGLEAAEGELLNFEDPFRLFYSVTTDIMTSEDLGGSALLPSEQLEVMVTDLVDNMRGNVAQQRLVVVPEPEDPFVQIDVRSLLAELACGAVTSVSTLAGTYGGVTGMVTWLGAKLKAAACVFPVAECVVCRESGTVEFCCGNSMEAESRHWLCGSCRHQCVAAGDPRCPVCRDENVSVCVKPVGGVLIGVLLKGVLWAAREGEESLSRLSSILWSVCGVGIVSTISNVLGALVMASRPAASWVHGVAFSLGRLAADYYADVFHDAEQESFPVRWTHRVGAVTRYSMPLTLALAGSQGDAGDFALPEEEPLPDADPVFTVDFNMQNIASRCRTMTTRTLPSCYHHRFEDGVAQIAMAGPASWKFVLRSGTADQWVTVPDGLCGPDCAWVDPDAQMRFYAAYLELHRGEIGRRQMLVAQNGPHKMLLLEQIPVFCRPSWIDVDQSGVLAMTGPNWWEWLCDTFSTYRTFLVVSGLVLGSLGGIVALARLFGQVQPCVQSGYEDYTRHMVRQSSRQPRFVRVNAESDDVLQESPNYPKIYKNYTLLKVLSGGIVERQLILFGLEKHWACLPRHYVGYLRKVAGAGRTLVLEPVRMMFDGKPVISVPYTFDAADFVCSTFTDLAVMRVPSSLPMYCDMRSLFPDESQVYGVVPRAGTMLIPPMRKDPYMRLLRLELDGLKGNISVVDLDDTTIVLRDAFCYDYSQDGSCGSIVYLPMGTRGLYGMHVAGYGSGFDGRGYAVPLTKQLVDALIPASPVTQFEAPNLDSVENSVLLFEPQVVVEYLGSVPMATAMTNSKKSKIKPSLVARSLWSPATEPVIMDRTDSRYVYTKSPLVAGCEKHGVQTTNFAKADVLEASNALWEAIYAGLKPLVVEPARLTVKQAVEGVAGQAYYDPVKLNTSAGWPWAKLDSGPGMTLKSHWIQLEPFHVDERLLAEMERKEKMRRDGVVPFTVFCDLLKDERRDPVKVRKLGGTRVICASPVDYTLAMRQNYLHFCAAFMAGRFDAMHAVGINVFGDEWSRLYQSLMEVGPSGLMSIDYSNFGPGLNTEVAEAACSIMVRWTVTNVGGVNESELWALAWECLHSAHLMHNTVYRQMSGSPSGAAFTVVINSLVNQLYVMLAWKNLVPVPPGGRWSEFFRCVRLYVYGDDAVMSVDPKYESVFNMSTIIGFFAKYGVVATDADKTAQVVPMRPAGEVTFLQRRFIPHPLRPNQWLAPLAEKRLKDIGLWIWPSPSDVEATEQNVEAMVIQAHGWGPQYFDELKERVNAALRARRMRPVLRTWAELDHMFYEQRFVPSVTLDNMFEW